MKKLFATRKEGETHNHAIIVWQNKPFRRLFLNIGTLQFVFQKPNPFLYDAHIIIRRVY